MKGPDTYDTNGEKEEFLKLIHAEKKPAGILVSAADANLMKDAIDQAIAAGVNVITIDSDSPDQQATLLRRKRKLRHRRRIRSVHRAETRQGRHRDCLYHRGPTNIEDRLRGYKDVFANYPAVRIIETVDIKGQANHRIRPH